MSPCLAQPHVFNTLAFEDIFIKLLKKHLHWLPPAALASLEMEFRLSRLQNKDRRQQPWLQLPTAL